MNSKIRDYAELDTRYKQLEGIIELSNRINKITSTDKGKYISQREIVKRNEEKQKE